MNATAQSHWVLTGDRENWLRGITDHMWGVVPGLKSAWDALQKDDFLFFYAKAPTSGIFGTGIVRDKFLQNRPLWVDEIRENKVLYPYRFTFDIVSFIDEDRWASEAVRLPIGIPYRAGMNRIANTDSIHNLLHLTNQASSAKQIVAPESDRPSRHNEIRDKLREIGQLQNFLSETECKLNGERLDVAWRRVAASVPQKVFEVQVSGNLYSAVAKLKKAHVLWNSQPFLVLPKDDRPKANEMLAGPFHEIKEAVLVRDIETVDELYARISKADEMRRAFGL